MSEPVFEHRGGITAEEIARVRAMIGQPLRIEQFNHEATYDSIRHYAHGLGDDNPLWCDADYAAAGPYGTMVAPPTFCYSVFSAGVTPGFDAAQVFFGSARWEVERLARRGDRIIATAQLVDMFEVTGRKGGRMVVQVGETLYKTPEGELLARYISKSLRAKRADQSGGLHYEPRQTHVYSAAEKERIESGVLGYRRRGAPPRYFEDVAVGEQLPELIKGPLTITTLMTYYAGNLPTGYKAADMQTRMRHAARHAPDTVPNNRASGWLSEAVWPGEGHLDGRVARAVGMPGVYDNGWMRLGWVGQLATDWAGDHGHLKTLDVRANLPNLVGDTLFIRGTVSAKRIVGDAAIVDLDLRAENQLGDLSANGRAEVVLPRAQGRTVGEAAGRTAP